MVIKNKALICALSVLINSQYASNKHAYKKPVNSENWSLNMLLCIFFLNQKYCTIICNIMKCY